MRLSTFATKIATTRKRVADLDEALAKAGWSSADTTRKDLAQIQLLLEGLDEALSEDACVKCLADLNDGEGYDGYCGNCADRRDHLYA